MDKLQFLDLTDLNASDEEQLNNILFNAEYPEAVELPPEHPPAWIQHPVVAYQPEPVNGGEPLGEVDPQQVDYAAGSPLMAPHTVQYTQMMPPPSVYVSNVTANVNVHGFMPTQPLGYPTVGPFIPSVDPQTRKPRTVKTPTKRSPEVRRGMESPQTANYTPSFPQHFPTNYYPQGYYLQMPIPSRPFVQVPAVPSAVYPPAAAPVFSPAQTFPPAIFTPPHHVQQPPSEPREDNPVHYIEGEEEKEQQDFQEPTPDITEEEEPADNVIVENTTPQQCIEEVVPVVETKAEEVKLEKPLVTKAPPANAFRSAPNPTQKPPFPPSLKPKRLSVDGPEFIDPPVETGPLKKSFASLFGSGDRTSTQPSQCDSTASKPLAMIHPTVHNNVNSVAPTPRLPNSTPTVQENNTDRLYSKNLKVRPEKTVLVHQDYDINLQRLGELLSGYQLDHKPLLLQPRGLTNRSNYCYINAILQALIACPPFYNLMKAIPPTQENKGGKSRTPIIDSMVKFVNEFSLMSLNTRPVGRREKIQATKDGNASAEVVTGPSFEPVYVYKMLSAMHAAFPVEGRQEDAEEFLSCLLNGLNDEMLEAMKLIEPQSNGLTNGDVTSNGVSTSNSSHDTEQDHEWTEVVNKSNKSVVTRRAEFGRTPLSAIFRGQMRSRVFRAGIENGTTDNIQPFFTLQLDVEKASSVEKALELLVGKDEVVGSTCPKTNQEVSMFTQTSLEELPLILLLHLKCFDYKLHTCSKIIKTVEFPVDLKIDNKLCTSKSKTPTKDRQYKLLAVVYHDGKEATKGHYVTDVFHTGYSSWVRFDDATVRSVTQQQVLNPRPPRVPYLLYYRRCDTIGIQDKNR